MSVRTFGICGSAPDRGRSPLGNRQQLTAITELIICLSVHSSAVGCRKAVAILGQAVEAAVTAMAEPVAHRPTQLALPRVLGVIWHVLSHHRIQRP